MTHAERRARRQAIAEFVRTSDAPDPLKAAADKFGVLRSLVYSAVSEHSPGFFRERRASRRAAVVAFLEASADPNPVRAAALRFGVSEAAIYKTAERTGTSHRPGREISRYDLIADLCNTDESLGALARRRGLSRQRVCQVYARCRAAGIPVRERKPSGAP